MMDRLSPCPEVSSAMTVNFWCDKILKIYICFHRILLGGPGFGII